MTRSDSSTRQQRLLGLLAACSWSWLLVTLWCLATTAYGARATSLPLPTGYAASGECVFYSNYNLTAPTINTTAASSATECCALCRATPGCAAAVYGDDYNCYMKSVSAAHRTRSLGGTVCVPPATPHTSLPPQTSVPSNPPTEVPSPSTPPSTENVTVVRFTHCDFNSMCNTQTDNTCHTFGYVPGSCYPSYDLNVSTRAICSPQQMVTVFTYDGADGCALNTSEFYSAAYPLDQCTLTPNGHYQEYLCDNTTAFGEATLIERELCDDQCAQGSCVSSGFRSGQCSLDLSTFPSVSGGLWSVLPQCYSGPSGTFVAFFFYENTTLCEGDAAMTAVDKSNECHPNINEQWINTICSPQK